MAKHSEVAIKAKWTVDGKSVIRNKKSCPKCGPAVYLAEHYDRVHCGKCGYTKFQRRE